MSIFTREEIIKRADLERDWKRARRKANYKLANEAYEKLDEFDKQLMKKYKITGISEFFMELM